MSLETDEQFVLRLDRLIDDHLRIVRQSFELRVRRRGDVPPAEIAEVRARQVRRHLHASMRSNAVELMLVARPFVANGILCPSARLHGAVLPDDAVLLALKATKKSVAKDFFFRVDLIDIRVLLLIRIVCLIIEAIELRIDLGSRLVDLLLELWIDFGIWIRSAEIEFLLVGISKKLWR